MATTLPKRIGERIAEAVPRTEAHKRRQALEEVTQRWRAQCQRVPEAGDRLADELRALCLVYAEADAADPGRLEPMGLSLPATLVYAFLGESMAGTDERNPGKYQLWREQCRERGWLPPE